MKKTTFISAILICVVPFTLVHAQRTAGHFSIGGYGGVGLPIAPEDLSEDFVMGLGFGGSLKFNLTNTTTIGAGVVVQKLMLDDEKALSDYGGNPEDNVEGGDINTNIIFVNLVQYFTSPDAFMGFYVMAGGGYYMMSSSTIKITQPGGGSLTVTTDKYDDNNIGINGGVGLEFGSGVLGFFVEGKFHYIFTENEATMIVTPMGGVIINL